MPHTVAVWLTADEGALSARTHAASRYGRMHAEGRHLVDKFLARTLRYQTLMLDAVERLGHPLSDSAAAAQDAVGRSAVSPS